MGHKDSDNRNIHCPYGRCPYNLLHRIAVSRIMPVMFRSAPPKASSPGEPSNSSENQQSSTPNPLHRIPQTSRQTTTKHVPTSHRMIPNPLHRSPQSPQMSPCFISTVSTNYLCKSNTHNMLRQLIYTHPIYIDNCLNVSLN